jgi:predicted PurR-regulated permease PerM
MVLALVVLVVALWLARTVVLVLFAGCLIAVLLDSVARGVRRVLPVPRRLGVSLGFGLLVLVMAAAAALFGTQVAAQADELAGLVPQALDRLRDVLQPLGISGLVPSITFGHEDQTAAEAVQRAGSIVASGMVLLEGGARVLLLGLVALFTGLFLALDPDVYRNGFLRLFPRRRRGRLGEVLDRLARDLAVWLRTQLLVMLFVGVACGLGVYMLGVPLAPFLGLIAGLFEFVPVVGPIAASIPAILVGLTIDPWTAVYVGLLYLAVNQIEGLWLVPVLQEKALALPAAATLVGVVLFGTLLGFLGVLLAVPLLLVLTVTVRMLYIEDILEHDGDSGPWA